MVAEQQEINDKFSMNELSSLRKHVIQGGLDTWQAAEMFKVFLACHGYGVSLGDAVRAAGRVEGAGCTLESLQQELDVIAVAN